MKATDFDATELESRELKRRAKLFRWFLSLFLLVHRKVYLYISSVCRVGSRALDAGEGCPAGEGYPEYAGQ